MSALTQTPDTSANNMAETGPSQVPTFLVHSDPRPTRSETTSPAVALDEAPAPLPPTNAVAAPGGEPKRSKGPKGRNRQGRGLVRILGEWLAIIAVALSVALLVRATIVQAFWIPTTSMTPTLKVNDRLLVDKVSFQVREIQRGEIIVFERPAKLQEDFKDLIKRVVGLPGDTVEGHDGAVFVNGKKLAEPYLPAGLTTKDFPPQQVPIDNYFVMGDNREVSWDSRYWGTVERKLVVGKAIVRVWPPSQVGRL